MLSVSMPNSATFSAFVLTATKCLLDRVVAERGGEPPAGLGGVGDRLDRGERLRADHHERRRRVEVGEVAGDVGTVDVADEAARQPGLAERLGGQVSHRRAEVAAADADVDHGGDPLAGGAAPRPVAHLGGERAHPPEHLVHVGHHVVSVDVDVRTGRGAQRGVQHGAPLGDVDLLPGEHRVAPRLDARCRGNREQRVDHRVVDEVLRPVDAQVAGGEQQARGALGVVGEQLAQRRRTRAWTGSADHAGVLVMSTLSGVVSIAAEPTAALLRRRRGWPAFPCGARG